MFVSDHHHLHPHHVDRFVVSLDMGAHVSLPERAISLESVFDALNDEKVETSPKMHVDMSRKSPTQKVVLSAWSSLDGETFHAIEMDSLSPFDPGECYIVLRVYDTDALASIPDDVSISPYIARLCFSAITNMSAIDVVTPLNAKEIEIFEVGKSKLRCNLFMWPRVRSSWFDLGTGYGTSHVAVNTRFNQSWRTDLGQ